jgi:hypothetical protein
MENQEFDKLAKECNRLLIYNALIFWWHLIFMIVLLLLCGWSLLNMNVTCLISYLILFVVVWKLGRVTYKQCDQRVIYLLNEMKKYVKQLDKKIENINNCNGA